MSFGGWRWIFLKNFYSLCTDPRRAAQSIVENFVKVLETMSKRKNKLKFRGSIQILHTDSQIHIHIVQFYCMQLHGALVWMTPIYSGLIMRLCESVSSIVGSYRTTTYPKFHRGPVISNNLNVLQWIISWNNYMFLRQLNVTV